MTAKVPIRTYEIERGVPLLNSPTHQMLWFAGDDAFELKNFDEFRTRFSTVTAGLDPATHRATVGERN